jgi:TolA-binding protein
MKQKLSFLGLAGLTILLATTTPADAANKEHQQLMADIRMMQEQAQLLQNLIGQVTDAIKAVNTRLDQQAEVNRKAMADQKLVIDNLSNDVRTIREKLDDNNVRLGSLSQEVDALRQAVQQSSRPPTTAAEPDTTSGAGGTTPAPANGGGSPGGTVVNSPTQMWNAAYADYTSGNFDLAVLGFDAYIKTFPKADKAPEAQVYICSSYLQNGKNDDAVRACDTAIRSYPGARPIPEAYYRKALAQRNQRDFAGARATLEEMKKKFPDDSMTSMGDQLLKQLPARND